MVTAEPADTAPRGALDALDAVLIREETLHGWALERRLFALNHRRVLLAATSSRMLWIRRRLIGGYDVAHLRWQDIEDAALHVGLLSAQLSLRASRPADPIADARGGPHLYRFAGLRRKQAQTLYRICQAQVEVRREQRRLHMEALHALERDGSAQHSAGGALTAAQRLQEARRLHEDRLITDAEYEAIKARVLAQG